jgi:hypothetical protein
MALRVQVMSVFHDRTYFIDGYASVIFIRFFSVLLCCVLVIPGGESARKVTTLIRKEPRGENPGRLSSPLAPG